ncbi:cytochrome c oxidase subunit II [Spirosoma rhododendri]|uniref:cytochrome-c oxidase n=1 Tax=Spirosoma rhododendri TaxID=2728024 RepID=A0A7L5DPK6_9BACT|nr:cytochrome c oxidase subunit II [Spirosoma rhododendri]QJD78438.1 cytochrome c oxidase subunit II [Spirosoma rhododendri]
MEKFSQLPYFLSPASGQADRIASLTTYFIIAALFVLAVVIGLLIYVSVRFRAKPGDGEPKQFTGNKVVEGFMIGVPTLLVAVFMYLTIDTMANVMPAPAGNQRPDVVITGHRYWWEASYPGTKAIVANEIHLPVGRKLLVHINAADVIHDWWVPQLGAKMDAIPGRTNYVWTTIQKPGVYEGACSEFCGAQHAWMRIKVVAQPEAEFRKWVAQKEQDATTQLSASAQAGAAFFSHQPCGSCHRIRGTAANGNVGPDLTHFGSRKIMLAGLLENNPENLRKWLTEPQHVKPGALMPRFGYPKDSITVLVDYLTALK